MKIFDLTRGKYQKMYSSANDSFYADGVNKMSWFSYEFASLFAKKSKDDVAVLLNNIPVFLVETSMSEKEVFVPECQCSVLVPPDNYPLLVPDEEFDIDKWIASKMEENPEFPKEEDYRKNHSFVIYDRLAVYIYDQFIIPRRIFIWMDKIKYCAEKYTKDKADINDNARALFDLVLFHEMSHALMDVQMYGQLPAHSFSYASDYPYRFIEEAYADCVAWAILMNALTSKQKKFLENFVYNKGQECICNLSQWLGIKILFNHIINNMQNFKVYWDKIWEHKKNKSGVLDIIECFKDICHEEWIAVVVNYIKETTKWGLMERDSKQMVKMDREYDYISRFYKGIWSADAIDDKGEWVKIDYEGRVM